MKNYSYGFFIGVLLLSGNIIAQEKERVSFNNDWKFAKTTPDKEYALLHENSEQSKASEISLEYEQIKNHILPTGNDFLFFQPVAEIPEPLLKKDQSVAVATTGFNDEEWRSLNLPHDWGIEGPFRQDYPGETGKLPWWGTAWYRKTFSLGKEDKGKQIYLDLDGVMSYSTVWCNGQLAGGWPYGYSSYRVDLTPYLKFNAENTIAIRVENVEESSRWYPGGGIYRNLWLVKTAPVSIAHWGTYVTTPQISADRATVSIQTTLKTAQKNPKGPFVLSTKFYERKANQLVEVAHSQSTLQSVYEKQTVRQEAVISHPKLWDVSSPTLYLAVTTLSRNGETLETYHTDFGIRSIQFTPNDGFYLNGRKLPLQGVCLHHDFGSLGAAFHLRAMERQLEMLKEMGVNAIRTSHNPPAPEMLDLCDRMGFLVIDEFTDTWTQAKKPNGYARLFKDWHEQDLRALIRRDRNHPCIIMWSTGNEIGEQGNPKKFHISQQLTDIAHHEDPTRPTTFGCNNTNAANNGFYKTGDIYGYNYKPMHYASFHKNHPNIPFYGSETSSCVSTRGEYFFPITYDKGQGKSDFQVSSYDLYAPGWAMAPDWEFKGQDENPGSLGEFVWTGFDYLGEPTPYNSDLTVLSNFSTPADRAKAEKELAEIGKIRVPSRSSYFGIIDLAGFPKDRFYLYQSRWRPDFPMAHILPHWNWPERTGQITPVHIYTSGDSAELFLNGRSLGLRKKKTGNEVPSLEEIRRHPEQIKDIYRLCWDSVLYEPGILKVVSYKNGNVWAVDSTQTSGEVASLQLSADRSVMKSDGTDLIFVQVSLTDAQNIFVPRAKNRIHFSVEGAAFIAATDNGDPTSLESFQNPYVNAFNGRALVILKSNGTNGTIRLTASADGLPSQTIELQAKP